VWKLEPTKRGKITGPGWSRHGRGRAPRATTPTRDKVTKETTPLTQHRKRPLLLKNFQEGDPVVKKIHPILTPKGESHFALLPCCPGRQAGEWKAYAALDHNNTREKEEG